jgi:threonine/homoserine/homoserine lactone efflux protein
MTVLVLAAPGPSVMYVVARSLSQGRRAGLWSVLGLEAGLLVHVCASAVGLSSALAASEHGYDAVRIAGAGYLVYLAVRQFRARAEAGTLTLKSGPVATPARWIRDGFFVDVLNPKTCLFFLAFLPQFVDPAGGAPTLQLLLLGAAVIPVAALCDGGYAVLAGSLRQRLLGSARFQRRLNLVTAGVYVLLAGGALLG